MLTVVTIAIFIKSEFEKLRRGKMLRTQINEWSRIITFLSITPMKSHQNII